MAILNTDRPVNEIICPAEDPAMFSISVIIPLIVEKPIHPTTAIFKISFTSVSSVLLEKSLLNPARGFIFSNFGFNGSPVKRIPTCMIFTAIPIIASSMNKGIITEKYSLIMFMNKIRVFERLRLYEELRLKNPVMTFPKPVKIFFPNIIRIMKLARRMVTELTSTDRAT